MNLAFSPSALAISSSNLARFATLDKYMSRSADDAAVNDDDGDDDDDDDDDSESDDENDESDESDDGAVGA
jgi:hypothetical protein